jgi:sec-independent protein translocase protein TatA
MLRALASAVGHTEVSKGNLPPMGSLSLFHWLVLLVVIMLLFGPSRLPSIGKNIGEAIRGLKGGLAGLDDENQKLPQPNTEPKPNEPPKPT